MKLLKEFRLQNKLTRAQMANILGVSASAYDKVEFGQRTPSYHFLKRLKDAFPAFDVNIFFVHNQHATCNF